jgi:hypothetical protein
MIEEQLNLFTKEQICEHRCRCGQYCHCEGCDATTCAYPVEEIEAVLDDMLDEEIDETPEELEQKDQQDDVRLVIAHDSVRELTINMLEVLETYDRIDVDDENIFIPRPSITRDVAHNLYNKLLAIHECLKAVRKNRQDTN